MMRKENRKHLWRSLALCVLLVLGLSLTAMAGVSKRLTTDMNFRKSPSGVKISSIPAGTIVEYNYSSGEWDNITYGGVAGWIHTGNLENVSTAPTTPSISSTPSAPSTITGSTSGVTMSVVVQSGYLALRTAKAYDYNNEIGKLYTGNTVEVLDSSDSTYWYVYAPTLGKYGYVNKNYLVYSNADSAPTRYVLVQSGYLALRTAKAYDYNNEIGKLYTGDTVKVTDTSDSQYWYVYAPSLGKYGYVNKDYLTTSYPGSSSSGSYSSGSSSSNTMTVSVQTGYLALRTAKAYDYNNEIGKLYTGDVVQVQDKSDSQYWYVYAPSLGKYGYVNKNYLVSGGSSSSPSSSSSFTRTVYVQTGYLALRTAKAYDYNNEIGKLYTGDKVQVQDTSDSQYWYVYAPSLNKYGYVNKDYLY